MYGPMTTAVLPLAGLPEQCPDCGHTPRTWPLTVFAGQLYANCPACHQSVAEVAAVAED